MEYSILGLNAMLAPLAIINNLLWLAGTAAYTRLDAGCPDIMNTGLFWDTFYGDMRQSLLWDKCEQWGALSDIAMMLNIVPHKRGNNIY